MKACDAPLHDSGQKATWLNSLMADRFERLFDRAEAILEGHRNGLGMPILRHLAIRHYGPALLSLADRATRTGSRSEVGRICHAYSAAGMMYRAHRMGEINAAQNLAMTLFNIGDMQGYRRWMHRAARAGDANAAHELKRFEVRMPHALARKLRRLRPYRRDGS